MGVRAVVDPRLSEKSFATLVFRGKDFDDLLTSITQALEVEMVKSPLGTYFFAAKPVSSSDGPVKFFQRPNGTWQRFERLPQDAPQLPVVPFTLEPGEDLPHIDPDFIWPKNFGRVQPLPYGEKREFNGRPFYNMPMPVPGWPDGTFSNPYILPMPESGSIK